MANRILIVSLLLILVMAISVIVILSSNVVWGDPTVGVLIAYNDNPWLFTHQKFLGGLIDKIPGDTKNPVISTQRDSENRTFSDCYSEITGSFLLGSMFTPFVIDLNDPEMKKFISNVCNFYYDKSGKWINIFQNSELNSILPNYFKI